MKNINQEEFIKLSEKPDYVILDVRSPGECASGIIEGATIINIMDSHSFRESIEALDKSMNYLIYCRSGNRSGQACMYMEQLGFEHTHNLVGGMMNWTGPVVSPV